MLFIAGLGNPGKKYDGTPHNLGFEVADILARRGGLSFQPSRKISALIAEGMLEGEKIALLKPMTYMNLSGDAVYSYFSYHSLGLEEMLIVTDDINLPLGRMRMRSGGSHGGHKGLLSIIQRMGTDQFPRLRIGVDPENRTIHDYVKFVLSPFHPEDRELVEHMKELAADAVEHWIREGLDSAANLFNRKDLLDAAEEED